MTADCLIDCPNARIFKPEMDEPQLVVFLFKMLKQTELMKLNF